MMGAIAMDNEMGLETHRNSLEAHRPLRQSVPPRSLIFFMLNNFHSVIINTFWDIIPFFSS